MRSRDRDQEQDSSLRTIDSEDPSFDVEYTASRVATYREIALAQQKNPPFASGSRCWEMVLGCDKGCMVPSTFFSLRLHSFS